MRSGKGLSSPWIAGLLHSVLRMVASALFMQAGAVKLLAFPIGVPPHGGTVPMFSEAWFAAILEVFGGGLLLVGCFTRSVAFLLSGEMAVAYFQFHFPRALWPIANGGVDAILYCFLWLYFAASGPGPVSVDAWRGKG